MLNLSHKKLDVYQISLKLVKEVYIATRLFPKEEQFVLISQIRRAAISISGNIAEGASRISKREKKRFYEMSHKIFELSSKPAIKILWRITCDQNKNNNLHMTYPEVHWLNCPPTGRTGIHNLK